MNEIWYTCPECGERIRFFPGFDIECQGTNDRPKHAFTKPKD